MAKWTGFVAGGIVVAAASGAALAGDTDVIVGFKGSPDGAVFAKHGGKDAVSVEGAGALAGRIPATSISALRADSSVAYVEEDGVVEAIGKPGTSGKPAPSQPAQATPWGVTRVNAPLSGNVGAGIHVAVIDTGIDLNHPDLAANIGSGANFVSASNAPEDDNGHGSHVAGTVAALDNAIGVVGVAPGATVHPVKVLDRRGNGFWSAVANGIAWAADNGMHIGNMSLGGSASTTVENACAYAADAGVLLIAAAGNEGDGNTSTTELSYPGAYSTVVAVGATDASDNVASFSNTGSFVEVSAPGVGIKSTYKGDGYSTLNGTSMACPHAAGVAALLWWEADQSGDPTAADVRTLLGQRVRDLGPSGDDNGYGLGVVTY